MSKFSLKHGYEKHGSSIKVHPFVSWDSLIFDLFVYTLKMPSNFYLIVQAKNYYFVSLISIHPLIVNSAYKGILTSSIEVTYIFAL